MEDYQTKVRTDRNPQRLRLSTRGLPVDTGVQVEHRVLAHTVEMVPGILLVFNKKFTTY